MSKHLYQKIFNECLDDMTEEERKNTMQFVNAYVSEFQNALYTNTNKKRAKDGFPRAQGLGEEGVKELVMSLIMEGLI